MEALRNPLDAAAQLQGELQAAGIESMVIGGLAVAVWGEPRATRDADIKVQLTRRDASRLIACLPADRYQLAPDSFELLQRLGFLFIQDAAGMRIDLLLAETSFDAEAIARRRKVEPLGGVTLAVCSPEDLVVYKLISTRPRTTPMCLGLFSANGPALTMPTSSDGWRSLRKRWTIPRS